jgi:hypothetical protein
VLVHDTCLSGWPGPAGPRPCRRRRHNWNGSAEPEPRMIR